MVEQKKQIDSDYFI